MISARREKVRSKNTQMDKRGSSNTLHNDSTQRFPELAAGLSYTHLSLATLTRFVIVGWEVKRYYRAPRLSLSHVSSININIYR